jgi:RimJ/RimL family protein N-acetyltransferase
MDLRPTLQNEFVKLVPLKETDFETLYKVASDPLIWEQHPNKNRWKREVFEVFFKGAIESKGAFLIYDAQTHEAIGSSRFYDWLPEKNEVSIGYTFFARSHWGGKYNPAAKHLMMEHAFKYVDSVIFHIGANNIRSQKAIERLGALKIAEQEMAYYGEDSKLNFIYQIQKRC